MTVTGVTTAAQAGITYAPPFKSVLSLPPTPQITGTLTRTPTPSSTGAVNPTVPATANDLDFVNAYLGVHQLSTPSYRYAILLWVIILILACIYALCHHLRYSGGFLGTASSRWSIRKKGLGGLAKKSKSRGGFSSPSETARKSHHSRYSNGALIVSSILIIFPLVLCVVGADYIPPTSSLFAFTKRAVGNTVSAPSYSINKAFWTSGARFGLIAFALMPLVVLLALKAPPIAIFSLRPFTHLYADKLAALHRTAAWLVWIVTTVHVALWTVQLLQDTRGDGSGRKVWFVVWLKYRFIFGAVAYGLMTAVMALSLRPVRKNHYEFFYIAHVVLVFLTLVCSAIHHPPLWYWMAIALALWGLERLFRAARFAKINGIFGKSKRSHTKLIAGTAYGENEWTEDGAYRMDVIRPAALDYGYSDQDLQTASPLMRATDLSPEMDKSLPLPPGATTGSEFGQRLSTSKSYYDEGSMHAVGSYESRITTQAQYGSSLGLSGPETPSDLDHQPKGYFPVDGTSRSATLHDGAESVQYHVKRPTHNAKPSAATVDHLHHLGLAPEPIPIGHCQAQLLPSKTVRLTVRVARPFAWSPGQSVLLFIPDLSKTQSHPFTILSVYQSDQPSEIVLLVKARKGLTLRLFNLVRTRAMSAMQMAQRRESRVQDREMQAEPVFLKAWVDGPMGSAGRVRWGDHSTVLLICGGTGVSFGAAVCSWVVAAMAARDAGTSRKSRGIGRNMTTQRVRFCWIVREWAEISWVAAQLQACLAMVPANMLQIDIFVTNSSSSPPNSGAKDTFFAPPQPSFARNNGSRRGSSDSISSQLSQDSNADGASRMDFSTLDAGSDGEAHYIDVADLTNYEDEEDVQDEAEKKLSSQVANEGKVRRARSRKAAKAARGSTVPSAASPSRRPASHLDDGSSSDHTHVGRPASGNHLSATYGNERLASRPQSSSNLAPHAYTDPFAGQGMRPNRESFRSIADSEYGRYDPYGEAGARASPSHSMFFDDTQSVAGESTRGFFSRASQTQSMIMLEGAAPEEGFDPAAWINSADFLAMSFMAEHGRSGKPKIAQVFEEELDVAKGSIIVASCGPVQLNTVVRNLVAKNISPARVRHGDSRGHIHFYSEDYES